MIRAANNPLDGISRWETPHLVDMPAKPELSEQALEELRNEALTRGYADGFQQGQQHADLVLQQKVGEIHLLLQALSTPFADINQQVLDALVALASKVARSLVKRELHTAPESIMALIRDTVSILNMPTQPVNVHLHPEDARLVSSLTGNSDGNRWFLIEDPMISRGDCKVSCQDSIVDGNLQSRINAVITQFQGDERG
jgi:flagellar assembly protein FliH